MEDKALVSVIIPAYNAQQYITRTVNSVLAQTYENMQIIVVDDGSTDDTPGICDRYAGKHENITAVHRENGGPSAARNAGLKIAKGT